MVKVRSLDHTRFVIVTAGPKLLYFAGRESGAGGGDWCTDLGAAQVYNDLHVAKRVMKQLSEYHNNAAIQFSDGRPFVALQVKLVEKKAVMVARLKYDGEVI